MAEITANFLSWFFPSIGELPEPVQVILGTVFIGMFFGMMYEICKECFKR